MRLKEFMAYVVIHSEEDIKGSQNWMRNGLNPPNLNIVVLNGSIYSTLIRFREFLLPAWARWNTQMPTNHAACLKLYINHKAPLNLLQNAPVFQLRYGATALLPYVQAGCQCRDHWYQFFKHISNYAGIMFKAFSELVCLKLCWHNRLIPNYY